MSEFTRPPERAFLYSVEDNLYAALRALDAADLQAVFPTIEERERLRQRIRTAAVEATAIRVAAEAAVLRMHRALVEGGGQ